MCGINTGTAECALTNRVAECGQVGLRPDERVSEAVSYTTLTDTRSTMASKLTSALNLI